MHYLVVGQTKTGKSWFCKQVAENIAAMGGRVIVYDHHCHNMTTKNGWLGAYKVFNDEDDFVKYFFSNTSCFFFVDECGTFFNEKRRSMLTEGRHWGHSIVMISQRANQITKTVREQATGLVMFRQGDEDSKALKANFVEEEILKAPYLQPLHYITCVTAKIGFAPGVLGINDQNARNIASNLLDEDNSPSMELMEKVGIFSGRINYQFLNDKGYYVI